MLQRNSAWLVPCLFFSLQAPGPENTLPLTARESHCPNGNPPHRFLHGKSPGTECKTQNSGLRSKEEKPRDPINQPSRCNMQEGLLSFAQTGDSDLLGGRAPRTANWASFIYAKKHTISILHTGCKVIGYTFAKQSYWYKLRGLHVYKAILLAQTSRAFVQT